MAVTKLGLFSTFVGLNLSNERINNGRSSFNGVFPKGSRQRNGFIVWRAIAGSTGIGASVAYAKGMERLAAKEALLLAFKDSGGLDSLLRGKTTDMERIDVNERITSLERLNPTPRPTTSPFLEGHWNFEWFGTGTPGFFTSRLLFWRYYPFASLLGLDVLIKDNYAKTTTSLKFMNSIETKFVLTTKLTVEGPLRMNEECIDGVLERPSFQEEALPEQLKGAYGQAIGTIQQLPFLANDMMVGGIRIPLTGIFQRMFMISYLDEEILIIRDTSGVPDVFTRLRSDSDSSSIDSNLEYES